MDKSSFLRYAKSDLGYLTLIGGFVSRKRKEQMLTQELLAEKAGVNRSTIQKIEKGEPINLLSLIQVLRVMEQLHVFDAFEGPSTISPLQLAELEHKAAKKQRVRITGPQKKNDNQSDW